MIGKYTPVFTRNITYKAFFSFSFNVHFNIFYGIECYVRDGGIAHMYM